VSPSQNEDGGRSIWVQAGVVGALGSEFVGAMVGAYFLGSWLDEKLGTQPWLTLACFAAAMFATGWHVVAIAKRFMIDDEG